MRISRRELTALMPALAAAQKQPLASATFKYEDLPVRANGQNRSRQILNGGTHTGYPVELHETELAPGMAPHPPHQHAHEEILMLREGTLEVTISGKKTIMGPGSVAWVASNDHHGWRNVGEGRARYFVMALGRAS